MMRTSAMPIARTVRLLVTVATLATVPAQVHAQQTVPKSAVGLAKVDSHVVANPKTKRTISAIKRTPVSGSERATPAPSTAVAPKVTIRQKPLAKTPR